MKKITRIISLAIVFVLCALSAFALTSCSKKETDDNLEYLYLTMKDNGGNEFEGWFVSDVLDKSATEVIIPETIGGEPVIGIYEYAFQDCTAIKKLSIPKSIVYIDRGTFEKAPSTITELYYNAVELDDVVVESKNSSFTPAGITYFKGLGVGGDGVAVTIGKDVKSIPGGLFYVAQSNGAREGLPKITSVTFEAGSVCETIGTYSFYGQNIESIELPKSVQTVEQAAFSNGKLTSVKLNDGLLKIEAQAFCGNSNDYPTTVSIPSSVTYIGGEAFGNELTSAIFRNPQNWENVIEDEVIPEDELEDDKEAAEILNGLNVNEHIARDVND